mmetsp:Transcript_11831/g.35076  ORF Transcript_11831/g.35076 Transcript_11831/m.35076 type:complete len:234 (+) Transcript_11831:467-1168(+)
MRERPGGICEDGEWQLPRCLGRGECLARRLRRFHGAGHDIVGPGFVRPDVVAREAHELDPALLEFGRESHHACELCGAHGREVAGVRKEDRPVAMQGSADADEASVRLRRHVRAGGPQEERGLAEDHGIELHLAALACGGLLEEGREQGWEFVAHAIAGPLYSAAHAASAGRVPGCQAGVDMRSARLHRQARGLHRRRSFLLGRRLVLVLQCLECTREHLHTRRILVHARIQP